MRTYWVLAVVLVLGVLFLLAGLVSSSGMAPVEAAVSHQPGDGTADIAVQRKTAVPLLSGNLGATGPIIVDHTCTDLSQVPDYWIDQAKALLTFSYGHTSHGSQPITGMSVLEVNTPGALYDFNTNGDVTAGVLSLADRWPDGDLGNPDRVTWEARTRTYLDGAGSGRNVVVWSWCGQVSGATYANIQTYLNLMNGLEKDYPNVTFVYMTGHLDGGGVEGNLNVRNEQIRQYCRNNNKILFDFADIESYDPDGAEFLSKDANDGCNYSCATGTCNWADQWCGAHGSDPLCDSCSCAHSKPLNCNLKARAFWWMMARIAGWAGPGEETSQKSSTTSVAYQGDVFTYTIEVRGLDAPPATTIYLTDVVPAGVEYISDTLDAASGVVDDDHSPTLLWSGVLDPAPVVLVTYAVSVTESGPRAVINTATLDAPGHDTAEHSATVLLNPLALYFPLGARHQ